MNKTKNPADLLSRLEQLNAQELRRLLVEHLTKRKLGLTWERNAIEHDDALNADIVLPRLVPSLSHRPAEAGNQFIYRNFIIEGDNFDSLRLLKSRPGAARQSSPTGFHHSSRRFTTLRTRQSLRLMSWMKRNRYRAAAPPRLICLATKRLSIPALR